jgi:guanine nucleotide-binding protein subunit alpha
MTKMWFVKDGPENRVRADSCTQNEMHDAMMTWDWICQSQWFKQTPLVRVLCSPHGHAYTSQILIWTNIDLFERKVVHSDIKNFFPDYKGPPGDAEAGREYFEMCFMGISAKPGGSSERNIFFHLPTMKDTTMLQRIISNVEECVSLVRRSAPARQRIALPPSLFTFHVPSSNQPLRL